MTTWPAASTPCTWTPDTSGSTEAARNSLHELTRRYVRSLSNAAQTSEFLSGNRVASFSRSASVRSVKRPHALRPFSNPDLPVWTQFAIDSQGHDGFTFDALGLADLGDVVGRIHIEKLNGPFLFKEGGTPAAS